MFMSDPAPRLKAWVFALSIRNRTLSKRGVQAAHAHKICAVPWRLPAVFVPLGKDKIAGAGPDEEGSLRARNVHHRAVSI